MSYILEALKKAEKQRENKGFEKPLTFSYTDPERVKKRVVWPYLLMAVLFLNAIVLFLIFGPGEQEKIGARQREPKNLLKAEGKPSGDIKESFSYQRHMERIPVSSQDKKIPPSIENDNGKASTPNTTFSSVEKNTPSPQEPLQKERERLFLLEELPLSIRKELPDFRISGHAYSDDRRTRVVRINEKILVEGQYLLPEIKLEEITRDGVIFLYKSTRFLVKLNENR
ncbi:MAG: general secretion pathway protein GspB [Syntrophorhabdaceae bacterium]|nr:general secretion pathway protein GspB [Syntrophorhabdaceae bacterium]